ncbi:hypothetical protein GH721_08235 [Kriegella sp. EG-1]|nr:hypothetical protein [Flavobacteriaceae bacterium EG-1]
MIDIAKNKGMDYVVLGLTVFLVFCLIFDSYIVLPRFVGWVGRWHPLVLHFPIVLLLICVFLGLTNKNISPLLFTITVLLTLVTAISGFFLSKETGIKGSLIIWHQWLGGALALLVTIWYWLSTTFAIHGIIPKIIQGIILILVLVTGHFGGMVTHGEDFLALPIEKRQEGIPENPLIFANVVSKILDDKCVSCHNPNKKKGELLLNTFEGVLAGGEFGSTVIPYDIEKSELIKRLHLPIDDEKHMPPEGKKQLTTSEINIIERWIALGASDTLKLNQLPNTETLVSLVTSLMKPEVSSGWENLPILKDSVIDNLSTDYITIKRIASNINALSVDVYKPPTYDSNWVLNLNQIAKNIIELDLSGLPISDNEFTFITTCNNLERLEIDKTSVGDNEIKLLLQLKKLEFLKVFNTDITDESIKVFKEMNSLKSLYLGGSKITDEGINNLKLIKPDLQIIDGIAKELESFFIATDSVPKI